MNISTDAIQAAGTGSVAAVSLMTLMGNRPPKALRYAAMIALGLTVASSVFVLLGEFSSE